MACQYIPVMPKIIRKPKPKSRSAAVKRAGKVRVQSAAKPARGKPGNKAGRKSRTEKAGQGVIRVIQAVDRGGGP